MVSALLRASSGNLSIMVSASWQFRREVQNELVSDVQPVSSGHVQRPLTRSEAGNFSLAMGSTAARVVFDNLIPLFVHLSASESSREDLPIHARYINISCVLQRQESLDGGGTDADNKLEWWDLGVNPTVGAGVPSYLEQTSSGYGGVNIVTVSDMIIPSSLRFLTNYGIIGLYLSIVLVVGRFLRQQVSDLSIRIRYDDMPQVDALQNLCTTIGTARCLGDFVLEQSLYNLLIEIYRSDASLKEWTQSSGPVNHKDE
jgi:hypothetical protein